MADFSHLSATTADTVGRYVQRGGQATDEMLLEAFERLDPPPLSPVDRVAIRRILSRQRGRPPREAASRAVLAKQVMAIDHPEANEPFRRALSERLTARKGLTEFERALPIHQQRRRQDRDLLIRGLYRLISDRLRHDDNISLPYCDQYSQECSNLSLSERALKMTQAVLRNGEGMAIPGTRRMMNIISEKCPPPS